MIKSAIVVVFFLLENDERAQSLSLTFRNKDIAKVEVRQYRSEQGGQPKTFCGWSITLFALIIPRSIFFCYFYTFSRVVWTFIRIALSFVIPFVFIEDAT